MNSVIDPIPDLEDRRQIAVNTFEEFDVRVRLARRAHFKELLTEFDDLMLECETDRATPVMDELEEYLEEIANVED